MSLQHKCALKQHFLSSSWPSMTDAEYQKLKDSILLVGVQNPITIYEGEVLDGWHRYRAATELGMPCPSKELGDIDPIDYVKSQNESRRNHLTDSQIALAVATMYSGRPVGRPENNCAPGAQLNSQPTIAKMAAEAGVSVRTMNQANTVKNKATQQVKDAVKDGTMSVKKAAATVAPPRPDKPAKSEPAIKEQATPEFSALDEAQDHIHELQLQNQHLQDRLDAVVLHATDDEAAQALERTRELREQVRTLEINLDAVTRSRDQYQNEAAQSKKQCVSLLAKLKRLQDGH